MWTRNWLLIVTVALLTLGQVPVDAGPRPRPRPQQRTPAAQPNAKAAPSTRRPTTPQPARRSEKIPEPEEIGGSQLQTRDGVKLSATFYPGTKEKESVPVLLLHNWKSSRKEFATLAPELQKKGCAVLVPDLRGHGESTSQMVAGRGGFRAKELDAANLRTTDYGKIATGDMAALRRFLVKKNNDGELNLNKLVIVGSEMGAAVGMVWAAYDWSIPNYEHAGIKQGQDVKALVLISPRWTYAGLDTSKVLSAPNFLPVRNRLSVMILVGGENSSKLRDAQRIESAFLLKRAPQPEALAEREVLLVPPFPTSMQAERLLNMPRSPLPRMICHFIEERVIKGETDAAWMEHR